MTIYPIRIDNKDYAGDWIRSRKDEAQAVLKSRREFIRSLPRHKKRLSERMKTYSFWPCCTCQPTPVPLSIKKYNGNYILCRMPGTGSGHAIDCKNHEIAMSDEGLRHGKYGINYEEDGSILISIEYSLESDGTDEVNSSRSNDFNPEHGLTFSSNGRVTLLGMLWYFWDFLKLNTWITGINGDRNLDSITKDILKLNHEKIFIKGYPLEDVLICTSAFSKATILDKISRQCRVYENQPSRKMLLMGKFSGFDEKKPAWNIKLLCGDGKVLIWMSNTQFKRLRNSYMTLGPSYKNNSYWMIAVVHIDVNSGNIIGDAVSAMLMNHAYIPAHSSYEVKAADFMIEKNRSFIKPVIYDRSKSVHPDFFLLDCDCCDAHPFEVVGMATQDYQSRHEEKMKKYEVLSPCGCSIWNVYKNQLVADVNLPTVKVGS